MVVDRKRDSCLRSQGILNIEAELSYDKEHSFTTRFVGDKDGKIELESEKQTQKLLILFRNPTL